MGRKRKFKARKEKKSITKTLKDWRTAAIATAVFLLGFGVQQINADNTAIGVICIGLSAILVVVVTALS